MFADNERIAVSIRRVRNGFLVEVNGENPDIEWERSEFIFTTMKEVLEFLEARYVPTEA